MPKPLLTGVGRKKSLVAGVSLSDVSVVKGSNVESLNNFIRKAIKNHKAFPREALATRFICLAIEARARKWSMPIRICKAALNRFMVEDPDCRLETRWAGLLYRNIYRLELTIEAKATLTITAVGVASTGFN